MALLTNRERYVLGGDADRPRSVARKRGSAAGVATLAGLWPSGKASHIDPVQSLRD